MTTETDIETTIDYEELEKLLRGQARNFLEMPGTREMLHRAADAVHRLCQHISELEYWERSRECVHLSDINTECREHLRKAMAGVPDRPDAVQILREKAREHAKLALRGSDISNAAYQSITDVADALEKERNG